MQKSIYLIHKLSLAEHFFRTVVTIVALRNPRSQFALFLLSASKLFQNTAFRRKSGKQKDPQNKNMRVTYEPMTCGLMLILLPRLGPQQEALLVSASNEEFFKRNRKKRMSNYHCLVKLTIACLF